jgi:cytochrome c oxidase subunit IV
MSGHVSPKSTYYAIFGALMVLTGVTIAVAFVPLGALNFPVAISIAILKATLVVLFFMHVKYSSRLTKMIVGMALFFLFIMFGLMLTDYLSRGWYTSPRGSSGAGTQVTIDGKPAPRPAAAPRPAEGAGEGRQNTSPK